MRPNIRREKRVRRCLRQRAEPAFSVVKSSLTTRRQPGDVSASAGLPMSLSLLADVVGTTVAANQCGGRDDDAAILREDAKAVEVILVREVNPPRLLRNRSFSFSSGSADPGRPGKVQSERAERACIFGVPRI